jgi:hypothetical protein
VFLSEKLHATIHFILAETGQVDAPDAIRQKEDLILSMKKNLEVTLVNELNDRMIS